MTDSVETSFSIPKTTLDQAAALARRLSLSQDQLFEHAITAFIEHHQNTESAAQPENWQTVVNQGDIYWLQGEDPVGSGIPHPYLVIQDDVFNHSRIDTVVVCALTSNIKRINLPGNVLLDAGEANLPRPSVVEVSKLSSVNKVQLGAYIGSLTERRVQQVLAGLRFLQSSF
jgi:mRNA interferase MazF